MEREIWVSGIPTPYSCSGWREWEATLNSKFETFEKQDFAGLNLKFNIQTLAPKGHPLDVDNLCELVFASFSRRQWCYGNRRNLNWWRSTKLVEQPYGMNMIIQDMIPENWTDELGEAVFDEVFTGPFPENAKDEKIPNWISSLGMILPAKNSRFALKLDFGSDTINIGAIANNSVVKHVIDCLWKIVGGEAGRPEDHKIDSLFVRRGVQGLSAESVRITFWKWV